MYNCRILGNTLPTTATPGGGAYKSTLYNCLIATNSGGPASGGIAALESTLYNCTVVSNTGYCLRDCNLAHSGNLIYNTISYSNQYNFYACSWSNSCTTPAASSNAGNDLGGNTTGNPSFASASNWRLSKGSPCINNGKLFSWMTDSADVRSKDLAGNSRVDGSGLVDMGCYEYFVPSGTIFMFR